MKKNRIIGELLMSYMNPIAGFEPGPTTKNLLLYVNKKERQIGQTKLPGLFQDRHFDIMICFFIIALVLECVGLLFIIDEIGLGFWQGFMSVAFLILLDLLFAFLYHLKTKTICLCENRILALSLTADGANKAVGAQVQANRNQISRALGLTADGANKVGAQVQLNKNKISRSKIIGFLMAILIWGLAVSKVVSFLALQSLDAGGIDTRTVFILATYVIVALIHVNFTGYALFGLFARIFWWRDERAYVNRDQPPEYTARKYLEDIVTSAPIPEATAGKHALAKLLSVNLKSRDEQGRARVVLGSSLKSELEAKIRPKVEQQYVQEQGVPKIDLPRHQAEINGKVLREIDEMIIVDIDPRTTYGILHPKLIDYLEILEISPNVDELAKGQTLYRLESAGLLLDDELVALASSATQLQARNEIALYGLHQQLKMI